MSSLLSVVYKTVIWIAVGERRRRRETFPVILLLWQNMEGREHKRPGL